MSTRHITAAELRRMPTGSLAAHEELQAACLTFLKLNGVPARAIHTGPRVRPREGGGFDLRKNLGGRGMADILAALPPDGQLLLIDLKTGNARLSAEQREFHDAFRAAGAICLEVHDVRDLLPYLGTGRVKCGAGSGGSRAGKGASRANAVRFGERPAPVRPTNGGTR